jgi:predicted nucleic acid-binding protein
LIVLDASVWISTLVPNELHHSVSREWLGRLTARRVPIAIPTLFLAEVSGSIARKTGLGGSGASALQQILTQPLFQLYSVDFSLGQEAARIASSLALRGADATYVALAIHLDCTLFTWDTEVLARAATVVDVLAPS